MEATMHTRGGLGVALLAIFGCGDDLEVLTFTDEGDVCVTSDEDEEMLDVTVTFDPCSTGCSQVLESRCEATLEDDATLHVESLARVEVTVGEDGDGDCPDACVVVQAQCTVEAQDEEEVRMVHGDADPEVLDVQPEGECE